MTPHCCPHQASCPLDLAAVCGQGPALSSNLAWVISMPYANGSPCNILNNFYPSPWPYHMLLLPVCFCIDQNWNHLQRTDSTLSTKTRKLSFTVLLNIQLSPPPNSNRNRDRLRSTSVRLQHQETIQRVILPATNKSEWKETLKTPWQSWVLELMSVPSHYLLWRNLVQASETFKTFFKYSQVMSVHNAVVSFLPLHIYSEYKLKLNQLT